MVEVAPFREAERQELREVAKSIIDGGEPPAWLDDTAKKFGKLIAMYLMTAGREGAELTSLPYSGGFMEQPHKTMLALSTIQAAFAEKLRQERKVG